MADETTVVQTDSITVPEQNQDGLPPVCKSRLFTWRLLGAMLALLVVLGWVFIIVMLILEEKWQLVLVAWLLLYSAAHFCYWYCKRHSLITIHRQIRLRVLTRMQSGELSEKMEDTPPTYDEVMDTEAPPPAYFTVVKETTKPSDTSQTTPGVTDIGVATVSGLLQQRAEATDAKEYYMQNPPAYQTPRHMRKLSPRILPPIHEVRAPMDTAVTATAAATAIATAAAALTAAAPSQDTSEREETMEEDPIRGPIVRHLRSTTIATLDVSSAEDVTPSVTRSTVGYDDEEIDLQAPSTAISGFA